MRSAHEHPQIGIAHLISRRVRNRRRSIRRGKTLLLRAIADLDPNDGFVSLDGRDRAAIAAPEWRRLVGYVPAEPGWWADTVGEHFAEWAAASALVAQPGFADGA